ncbi:MAG: hypothetical protein M3499_04290 [Actinomycetota bacterium]|nr:hypothetical protein [Actinomycetota bacterium]
MTTLAEAQDWLRERLDEGAACPCCTQLAKVYRRKINAVSARALIALYRLGPGFHHMPTIARTHLTDVAHQGGYLTLSQHWRLIEEELELRDDGGRAGWWRITDLGARFTLNQIRLPKYARIYDGRCLGLIGEPQGIRDALGTKFDYRNLMDGT